MSFFDVLPQELFIQICTKLPIKTIVLIRCVRKSWNAVIKNPTFITEHINRTIADKKTQLRLLRYHSQHDEEEHFSMRYDNETFDEFMSFDSCFGICSPRYYRIVGSINGLICLSDDFFINTSMVIIWNPAIRKTLHVPLPPSSLSGRIHKFVVGFGFNSCTNDFKVVRIVYFWGPDMNPEVEVYEISTDLWRSSSRAVVPPYEIINPRHCSHVFVKGASHWVAFEHEKEQNRYLILSFDMDSEVFCEMMLPASISNGRGLNLSISLFGESLSLFHYDDGVLSDRSYYNICSTWVMKEYGLVESWTKLFTVDLGRKIDKALGFRKTGEVVLAKSNGGLVSYDPECNQEVSLGIRWTKYSLHLDSYMESLVLLDRIDQGLLNREYWFYNLSDKGEFKRKKIEEETSVKNAEGTKEK